MTDQILPQTCPNCGYDRTGIGDHPCPECGRPPPPGSPCPLCLTDMPDGRTCAGCGFSLKEDETLVWGSASSMGELYWLIGMPVLVGGLLIALDVVWRQHTRWAAGGAIILLVASGAVALAREARRQQGPLPERCRWQLRLSRRGVSLREGSGPPTWRRWRRGWRAKACNLESRRPFVAVESRLSRLLVSLCPVEFFPADPASAEPIAREMNDRIRAASAASPAA